MCHNVVTILFEVMDYLGDRNKDNITSGTNVWVRRSTKTMEPILVTELETQLTVTTLKESFIEL